MYSTAPAPTKSEIFAHIDPERKAELLALQDRFGRTKEPAQEQVTATLQFSGSPDFLFTRNSNDTLKARRVWLPMRHILIDEPISPLETPGLVYGNLADNTDDREVSVFQSTVPEKDLIFGIFTDRVMDSIREHTDRS